MYLFVVVNEVVLLRQTLPPEPTFDCCNCKSTMMPNPDIVQEEPYYFTMPFQFDKLDLFDFDPTSEHSRLSFFTNAERSLVVKEILDRTSFVDEDSTLPRYGSIFR